MRHWLASLLLLSSSMSFAETENLATLIAERLGHMRDVAAYKWQHELPIPDIARERLVTKAGMIAGLSRGVTLESSERFYRSQIEAAKDIQRCWHQRWRGKAKATSSVDLNGVLRPILIDLGNSISAQLSYAPPDAQEFNQVVRIECLSNEAKQDILEAVREIKHYPSRFRQIKASGVLRVGTTGDYAPFSFSANGKTFAGIDVDLAYELATHLNTSVIFIQTSWPTLMVDFAAGKFDIGMSGISITEQRKQQALFSKPYHVGGKTPIAPCNQVNSFSSIAAIDQPGTRIIVNPGGTNQRFLDGNIRRATILVFEDNRDIFQQIVNGRADLMITDRIEVALQSTLHPELCGLAGNATFTYQEKGYLIPRDPELQAAVNNWLDKSRQNGRLRDAFERYLSGN